MLALSGIAAESDRGSRHMVTFRKGGSRAERVKQYLSHVYAILQLEMLRYTLIDILDAKKCL